MSQTKTPPMVHKANEGDRMEKADRLQTDSSRTGGFAMIPLLFSSCCLDADLFFPHICQNRSNEAATKNPPRQRYQL